MDDTLQRKEVLAGEAFRKELVRKALHILIAFLPFIAGLSRPAAFLLLLVGGAVYTFAELTRLLWNGNRHFFPYALIRTTSLYVSRPGEANGFIIAPLTLAAGAGLTLLIFPEIPMRAGILALALGDTAAALAGKFLILKKPRNTQTKSFTGTAACFLVSGVSIWIVTGSITIAVPAAAAAALSESIFPREFDNLLVPLSTAAVVYLMM